MHRLFLAGAVGLTLPGLGLILTGSHPAAPTAALLFGLAVLGAAFLLSWAAEVAQLEISQALAVAALALIAVLPEYAVDFYFAWTAAEQPAYAAYAAANMTGANRLLVGFGWPLIVALFALRQRRALLLMPGHHVEVAFLTLATLYAFLLPLKGELSLLDALVLVGLFLGYAWRTAQADHEEPELVGPARLLGGLPRGPRRLATLALFAFSGLAIFLVAEPFAESLVASGAAFGVDEFLLVQWLAPLASEAPEFIVAVIWTLRGQAAAALGALLSSKVNQWSLLIGTLPVAYSVNLGRPGGLPLDGRQAEEVLLTAAQSLLAVAILLDLRLNLLEAGLLFGLFVAQLLVPDIRREISAVYIALGAVLLVRKRAHLARALETVVSRRARPAGRQAGRPARR